MVEGERVSKWDGERGRRAREGGEGKRHPLCPARVSCRLFPSLRIDVVSVEGRHGIKQEDDNSTLHAERQNCFYGHNSNEYCLSST